MHDKLNNQVITKEEFNEALEYVEKLEKYIKSSLTNNIYIINL